MSYHLSVPERKMYSTIEWLLALPALERRRCETAEEYRFSFLDRAPVQDFQKFEASSISTLDMSSVEAVTYLSRRGHATPLLLNFAHGYNCGGGFEHAGGSQEEDIFRKTSLFLSLWPHRRSDDGAGVLKRNSWIGDFDQSLPRKQPFYPHSEVGAILSPHVRLSFGIDSEASYIGNDSTVFSVLSCAAQDCNREEFEVITLSEKIRTILHIAAANKHRSLVLGAFGCGYFRNPREDVASTFHKFLGPQGEFSGVFETIIFAIPSQFTDDYSAFSKLFPPIGIDVFGT